MVRVFRAALRHSRHVRILRLAIPLSAAIVVVAGAAFTYVFKPLRGLSGMPVDVGSVVVSGTKIMMNQPRLAGVTRDNRRYDMVAQAAAQDLTKPDMVELQGIHATMEMRDKVIFETIAKDGLYNTKTEQLTLNHNIVVTSSSGYQAFLNEAVVDVRGSKIVSDKPGSSGAASKKTFCRCGVKYPLMASASKRSRFCAASKIVRAGKSWSMIARSPN